MAKRNVKLLLLNNNQIIVGSLVEGIERKGVIQLRDTSHLQADEAGNLGLAVHDLNGMIKPKVPMSFERSSITAVVDEADIKDSVLKTYLEWATGITQTVKPQILLKG